MRLAFYYDGDSVLDDLIRFRCNSPKKGGATHVSLLFSDGQLFSSDITTHGTAFSDGSAIPADPTHWQVVDLGDLLDEALLRKYCEETPHEAYGFVGDLCFFADIKDLLPARPFCSQVVLSAFQAQGVWTFANPTQISPRMLQLMALAIEELQTPPSGH